MTCFVMNGVNIYVSKHKFNSFEKMYDILMIFVENLTKKKQIIMWNLININGIILILRKNIVKTQK